MHKLMTASLMAFAITTAYAIPSADRPIVSDETVSQPSEEKNALNFKKLDDDKLRDCGSNKPKAKR